MLRFVPMIAAVFTSVALLGATVSPVSATTGPAYRLVPVTALAAKDTVIVNDVMWKCATDGCSAASATSRPAVVCAQAARKIGKVATFVANGEQFDGDALAKCNAKAK
jgi:hypothetical protein